MPRLFHNYGQRIAAIEESGNTITYDSLFEEADKLASHIGRRTLVFSLCTNSIGSMAGYAAFENHNIVPLLLAEKLDHALLCELIHSYHPEYLWLSETVRTQFPEYQEVYRSLGYVLLKTGLAPYPMYEELALLLTTSGSTGSPKLVKQSYKNIRRSEERRVGKECM